ncbi:reticulon-1 [Clonorchis sinensis]|uniref:Reticulon-like protein n=1 Tax=Clonorchis sinensis TaxID=79923 RepID=H2KTC3_CLOSI|nr:reticulon-1 [Clonorchis sinensis]
MPPQETAEIKSCTCPMKERVRSLIYWQDPIHSAAVLAVLLAAQFGFLYLSAISFVAYTGFFLLLSVNLCRLYYHYIAKTESQFIKDYLERDVSLPKDQMADVARRLTDHANEVIMQARDVFLLTNIGASVKFGVLLYLMTYVGARFNLLTLCITGTVLAFFLPKFYKTYQDEIDRALSVFKEKLEKVITQCHDKINSKLDKIPILGSRKHKEQ